MTLPRLWRLWTLPAPRTAWARGGRVWRVCYLDGYPGPRFVVAERPSGPLVARRTAIPLAEWRLWWLFAREVSRG